MIIEEAKPSEIAPLIIGAYGLSPSEARVTRVVLHGLSTKEIAAESHLSPYTVQDNLKVIFAKVGVHSCRELVARAFERYHWPRIRPRRKLTRVRRRSRWDLRRRKHARMSGPSG